MTHRTSGKAIILIIFLLISFAAAANSNAAEKETSTSKAVKTTTAASDHPETGNKATALPDAHSKAPHGKVNPPHMEELPHIHKFHKERVKKIKKHHSKYWLLSQVIIVLCHISILVIGYLHATH
jgi:hypothetical protein